MLHSSCWYIQSIFCENAVSVLRVQDWPVSMLQVALLTMPQGTAACLLLSLPASECWVTESVAYGSTSFSAGTCHHRHLAAKYGTCVVLCSLFKCCLVCQEFPKVHEP